MAEGVLQDILEGSLRSELDLLAQQLPYIFELKLFLTNNLQNCKESLIHYYLNYNIKPIYKT